jgi:hypothetical protein
MHHPIGPGELTRASVAPLASAKRFRNKVFPSSLQAAFRMTQVVIER